MNSSFVTSRIFDVASAGLALFMCFSCSAGTDKQFSKRLWAISDTYCPVGCSTEIREFLHSYIGQTVKLSATELEPPFLDRCDGAVHVEFKESSAAAVASDVRQSAKPGTQLSPGDLKISEGATVQTAIAYCKNAATDLPIARILSVEPRRVLLLFEQQSIVELR